MVDDFSVSETSLQFVLHEHPVERVEPVRVLVRVRWVRSAVVVSTALAGRCNLEKRPVVVGHGAYGNYELLQVQPASHLTAPSRDEAPPGSRTRFDIGCSYVWSSTNEALMTSMGFAPTFSGLKDRALRLLEDDAKSAAP